jgi:hypothetical protein
MKYDSVSYHCMSVGWTLLPHIPTHPSIKKTTVEVSFHLSESLLSPCKNSIINGMTSLQ